MTRVGLIHLTPEQLELLSAMTQRPDLEVVGAVHPDATSTPYKIAQVLAIPTGTDPEALRAQSPDLVVVPEEPAALRAEILALGLAGEVLTTREAAERYGLRIDLHPGIAAVTVPESSAAGAQAGAGEEAEDSASLPVGRGAPQLEVMLRDGLDEILAGEEELPQRLRRLAKCWAELLGAEACAITIADNGESHDCQWIIEGSGAALATGPDTVAGMALLSSIAQVYVRHDAPPGGTEPLTAPRRAIAAFPLEAVRGVVWFLDLRLPAHELDERLMILRRTARRLGRLLSLAGQVVQLKRDQAEAVRMADIAARIAGATEQPEIATALRDAIASELHPELAVLRLPGAAQPEIMSALPTALAAEEARLLEAEDELAKSTRSALRSQVVTALVVADRRIDGLAAPIRRSNECMGTLAVFRSAPASASLSELWSDDERRLLERLGVHAAGALALAAGQAGALGLGEEILDRRGLLALLRAEVRRSERYAVPFLLTVFDLEGAAGNPPPAEELVLAFMREFKSKLRAMDAFARLGPQRFAVLNPHTDRGGGRMVLRARSTLGQLDREMPGAAALEVRGNQIHFPADVSTFEELVTRLG